MATSDDEYQLTPKFERFFYDEFQQKNNSSKERFNDVLHHRTTTPSSRDSGIRVPSPSSCCSPLSERSSPSKSSLFEFYLHPPSKKSHHIGETITPMSYTYDSPPRYQLQRRHVHWNEQFDVPCKEKIIDPDSDLNKHGQKILLNASLPFHSKLNIRIHANRAYHSNPNETNLVKATATIQQLTPEEDSKHNETLRKSYIHHNSVLKPNESDVINSPIQYNINPQHRQISLPISLPIDRRLVLYIRDGEVLARC